MDTRLIGHTQQSKAPRHNNALQIRKLWSKYVPDLTMDDARDMYARDATVALCEQRSGKAKKFYIHYALDETIDISREDKDNCDMAK